MLRPSRSFLLAVLCGALAFAAVLPGLAHAGPPPIDSALAGAPSAPQLELPAEDLDGPQLPAGDLAPDAGVPASQTTAVPDPGQDPASFAAAIAAAVHAGQYLFAGALALIAIIQLLVWFGGKLHPALATQNGKRVLAFLAGSLTVIATGLGVGQPLSFGLVFAAMAATGTAMGFFDFKDLAKPPSASTGAAAALALLLFALPALAAPANAFGKIALPAGVATAIPSSGGSGLRGIGIRNLGAATIYCGWASTVTDANGWPIDAGDAHSFDIGPGTPVEARTLYCFSVAGQTSPADTRFLELR